MEKEILGGMRVIPTTEISSLILKEVVGWTVGSGVEHFCHVQGECAENSIVIGFSNFQVVRH